MRTTLGALALLVLTAAAAQAAPIYGEYVGQTNLTGSRSEATGGLVTGGKYAEDTADQAIAWSIGYSSGTWTYEYTLSGFTKPGLGHWILDLSDDCVATEDCFDSSTWSDLEHGSFGEAPSNPGFPAGKAIGGVKFDGTGDYFDAEDADGLGTGVFTFTSSRRPVWGDLYVKGGKASHAYNPGLPNPASENANDFIARPDGALGDEGGEGESGATIPEPATQALLGLGLLGLGALQRRRMRSRG